MKRLIVAKDVEAIMKQGETEIYVDGNVIITPSARDLAKANGIAFTTTPPIDPLKAVKKTSSPIDGIDNEMLITLFKAMMDQGLLQEMLNCLNIPSTPYVSERDPGGFKLVRGNTVKMDEFDTGNPGAKVHCQELINKEEAKMSAGFLTIENSRFDWKLAYEEIDYVIEGTLTVEINGKTYTAHSGDVLFVPAGARVVWGSPDKARIFYTTYPANWADPLL
ncbi:cupin domain-containing protein [Alkaliphilus crotonatoxidans]